MKRSSTLVAAVALQLVLAAPGTAVRAQEPGVTHPAGAHATREELRALLARVERVAASAGRDEAAGAEARRAAERIQARLREGDFRVGDPILLTIEGEDALSDTLTVTPGPALVVPGIGEVSLAGVLRSELVAHLAAELGRYLKDPVVDARPLIRLAVTGEVEGPGFYVLPAEAVLADVLMVAGGPTREAAIDRIRVERGDRRIWDAEAVQRLIAEGRTLEHLELRAGDRIVVPRHNPLGGRELLRMLLLAVPAVAVAVMQLF